jgi:hypothetical protein
MAKQSQEIDLIRYGLNLLREDMDRFPSFDPTRPYDEKNLYIARANAPGLGLLQSNLHVLAEVYFRAILAEILGYEQANSKNFNKGMVYANLGIAQIYSGKFDEGIANFLTAEQEDRPVVSSDWTILNTSLWEQFEQLIVRQVLTLVSASDANLRFRVDEAFLRTLFRGLEVQDRIFLEGTILTLYINLELHRRLEERKIGSNAYTRGRLYSGLKDLCLLTESLLREKHVKDDPTKAGKSIELKKLLKIALSKDGLTYPKNEVWLWANSLSQFLERLEGIFDNTDENDIQIRWVHCLHLLRNFTGHHFAHSEDEKSPKGRTFFGLYENVLSNVLSAILYLKLIKAI